MVSDLTARTAPNRRVRCLEQPRSQRRRGVLVGRRALDALRTYSHVVRGATAELATVRTTWSGPVRHRPIECRDTCTDLAVFPQDHRCTLSAWVARRTVSDNAESDVSTAPVAQVAQDPSTAPGNRRAVALVDLSGLDLLTVGSTSRGASRHARRQHHADQIRLQQHRSADGSDESHGQEQRRPGDLPQRHLGGRSRSRCRGHHRTVGHRHRHVRPLDGGSDRIEPHPGHGGGGCVPGELRHDRGVRRRYVPLRLLRSRHVHHHRLRPAGGVAERDGRLPRSRWWKRPTSVHRPH